MPDNVLYYGDNLDVLRLHVADESVDLIYLDPPFKSNQDYNVLFAEQDGSRSAAQIHVFEDTWEWNQEAEAACLETIEAGGKISVAIQALRQLLGNNDMMAYLAMMAPRLVALRQILKSTGSIYLHCDLTAGAYLRVLMDAIFGAQNFRNEIIWYYYNKMHDRRKKMFPRANDTILFYVKDVSASFTYHQLKEMRPIPVKQLARKKVAGKMVNVKDEEGHVVYRLKEDRTIDNVWRIACLQPAAPERLGYPTQKPEAMLDRIIEASSNPGDLVLDPFCGCGTAIASAHKLRRRWIGIDITHLAITLIKRRLEDAFGDTVNNSYTIVGEPTDIEGARRLAESDPYQFQWWALDLVHARPNDQKKGADKGIDGRLYFHDEHETGKTKQVLFSVKAGHTDVSHVRDLRGVLDREKAAIGVLITMEDTTKPMRTEAASVGFYESTWTRHKHPKLQLLTIAELLDGRTIDMPPIRQTGKTFKRAPKAKGKPTIQPDLPLDE